MTSNFSEHTSANYFLHTGSGLQGRPSMGAWFGYGLGSASADDLPGFVVLNGGLIPPGGLDNFNSGFLPASYQGSIFSAGDAPVANIRPIGPDRRPLQRNKLELPEAGSMDVPWTGSARRRARIGHRQLRAGLPDAVRRARADGRLAASRARRGSSTGSTPRIEPTQIFGRQCLLARRLVERGVRFIELTCPDRGRRSLGPALRPQERPRAQRPGRRSADRRLADRPQGARPARSDAGRLGRRVRPHAVRPGQRRPRSQSVRLHRSGWRAAASRAARSTAQTDEYGYKVVENKVEIHDLHATMLHLLGIDHKRLTFRFGGRDMRLTDVHGEVITPILA